MLTLLLATLYLLGATTGVHTSIPATTGATAPQPTLQTPATDTPAERRAETARLRLLQLDAAALGAATPSSDGGGEHTWSVSPRSRAVISDTGTWTDLPDSTLAFDLEREAHVVIRYVLVAVANKQYHAGGDFINEHQAASSTVSDYLGARLLLDSIPYRQSGSHAAPLSALETSTRQVSGYIVTRLGGRWHSVAAATPAPTTLEHDVSPRVTVSHAQAPCQGPGKTVLAKTTRRRRSHRCVKCKGPGDEVLLQSKRRHRSVETRLETRIRGKPQSPVEEGWPVIAW